MAAGVGLDGAELGTDATAIMAAIEEAGASGDGVLVLLDLGSAILSAELALDLLEESLRLNVRLCSAPLVEGAIAAAAQSGIGATLAEVRAEAENALRQKVDHLGAALPPVERADKFSAPAASRAGLGTHATGRRSGHVDRPARRGKRRHLAGSPRPRR